MITATDYLTKGIDNLGKILAPFDAFSTKFVQVVEGNSVEVPVVSGGTAKTKSGVGAYDVTGGPDATGVDTPLSHVYVPFQLDVTEQNASGFGRDIMNKFATAAESLGYKALQVALADMANFAATTEGTGVITPANFTGSVAKILAGELDDAAVPMINRAILADSSYFNNLLPEATDSIKVSVSDYGFTGIPLTAGTLTGANGVILGKASYAVAAALPNQTNSGKFIVWEDVETELGIPVRVKVWEEAHGLVGIVETRIGGKVAIAGKGFKFASA